MSQESNRQTPQNNRRPASSRRRRRRGINPLLYILLVIAVSALLAALAWSWAGDVLALDKEPHEATITLPMELFTSKEATVETTNDAGNTVTETDTILLADIGEVADLLKENGLIEHKFLFRLFCTVTGASEKEKLTPGTYQLNTDMDYNALINSMSSRSGSRMTTTVTIPEGYTLAQVFALLEERGVSTVALLEEVSANYDFKFDFLKGVLPLGDPNRLEGYLFPDTYEFYMGGGESAAVQVINKMLLRFDDQFSAELRQQAADMGYTVHEMLTIASLIEKETDGTDQGKIASVIYNRLDNPNYETVGLLQIDAAIAYVTGRTVTQADYQNVDSPYNTYLNKGLPPGPIANPGMASINAALDPESTNYFYYVVGDDNLHHFFRTSAEFEAFKATLGNDG